VFESAEKIAEGGGHGGTGRQAARVFMEELQGGRGFSRWVRTARNSLKRKQHHRGEVDAQKPEFKYQEGRGRIENVIEINS